MKKQIDDQVRASGREEGLGGGVETGEARTAARHLGLGQCEKAGDFAQLGTCGADDGGSFVEAFRGLAGSEREARLLLGATDGTEGVARAGERVAFTVNEAFDLKGHLDIAPAIETLTGAALAWLELRKLRLPEPEDVGFDLADARYVANLEIETVRNRGLFVDALGG
jgi:hypothetical protein